MTATATKAPARERVKIRWKRRFNSRGVDVRKVQRALRDLLSEAGGLKAEEVLEAARDSRSVLHRLFTWDDSAAAEAYRLTEARALVSNVVIVHIGKDRKPSEPIRAWFSVRSAGKSSKPEYVPIDRLEHDDALREQVEQDALDDLKAWQARYRTVRELRTLVRGIAALLKQAEKESDR